MSTAILNVPLHHIADISCLEQRHRMVMACMRLCFRDVVGELRPREAGAWSVIMVGIDATRLVFDNAVALMARQIGCGSIRLLHEDGSVDELGPTANALNGADILLPSICELAQSAA